MALVTCRDAAFSYEGRMAAGGLNFSVQSGDYLCIVGENGSGKSTVLKGILGLKKPQKGELLLGGGLENTQIGYLPQQSAVRQDFPASVHEVVISGRLGGKGLWPFYDKNDKAAARENMERLNISELSGHCYRELSCGQQQRVLLARALCATQKLILLDEPAAGLDQLISQELYRLLDMMNKELGITIIMVSHDISSALRCAGHILHLKNRQMFFGPVDDYSKTGDGALWGDKTRA